MAGEKKAPAKKKAPAAKKKSEAKKSATKSPKPEAEVTLQCGANRQIVKGLVGLKVEVAMKKYKEPMNIPGTKVRILVRGDDVSRNYILKENDVVDFLRQAGSKG